MDKDRESARSFYESERKNIVVTHDDFCVEQQFEYLKESENLTDYLLERSDWEAQFKNTRVGTMICHVQILNQIFDEIFKMFANKLDSVQVYHIITDFYNIDSTDTFHRLVHKHRERLKRDLIARIGEVNDKADQIDEFKIQNTFMKIFKNN